MAECDVYVSWATARNIIQQINDGKLVAAVKWIKDSEGIDLRCAKLIADALRDGDFEMENYLNSRYAYLSVEVSRLTIA